MSRQLALACVLATLVLAACGSTTDSLGYDDTESKTLHPLTGPASYPNPFRDMLGETDTDINNKVNNVFNTLFHGSPSQAFYVTVGDDQAYIEDTLHGDVRTEGIGLGMMICVEMNKEPEFDKLWTYAKQVMEVQSGPNADYFNSSQRPQRQPRPLPRSLRLRAVRDRADLRQRPLDERGDGRLRGRRAGAVSHAAPQGRRQRRRRR